MEDIISNAPLDAVWAAVRQITTLLIPTMAEGSVDLAAYDARRKALETLKAWHSSLSDLVVLISVKGREGEHLQSTECDSIRTRLTAQTTAATAPATAATKVVSAATKVATAVTKVAPAVTKVAPAPSIRAAPAGSRIVVAPGVTVNALVVKGSPDAIPPGVLCWIPSWGHFAVKVGGCLLHAGLGRIYWGAKTPGEPPVMLRDCTMPGCTGLNGCTYYHDPVLFPGTKNVRNYLADSFRYSGEPRPVARRVGSSPELLEDLKAVTDSSAKLLFDQVAHDLLLALIVWEHRRV